MPLGIFEPESQQRKLYQQHLTYNKIICSPTLKLIAVIILPIKRYLKILLMNFQDFVEKCEHGPGLALSPRDVITFQRNYQCC